MERVNYCLVCGTSKTSCSGQPHRHAVNYCLDYGTSEIPVPTDALPARVNYRLVYDVFETGAIAAGTLIAGELLPGLRYIRNADLVMSLSIKGENVIGELLLDLPYLRNQNSRFVLMQYGELLPGLPYLRNRAVVLCPLN